MTDEQRQWIEWHIYDLQQPYVMSAGPVQYGAHSYSPALSGADMRPPCPHPTYLAKALESSIKDASGDTWWCLAIVSSALAADDAEGVPIP